MFDLQKYLNEIGKCVGKSHIELYRRTNDGVYHPITQTNFDYLKPDVGFSAPLYMYHIRCNEEDITHFGLYEFPSCCAFCVSTQAHVEPSYRSKGVNKVANQLRQEIAREYGYSALLCTDVKGNLAERSTLRSNGFEDIYRIRNMRTNNVVIISVKPLLEAAVADDIWDEGEN